MRRREWDEGKREREGKITEGVGMEGSGGREQRKKKGE